MEPAKFTPGELEDLVAQTVSWMWEQREKFLPSSHPLNEDQYSNLLPFYSAEILYRLRVVVASATGQKIPYPPFYERVRAGGARVVPDAAHMSAIPLYRSCRVQTANRRYALYSTTQCTSGSSLPLVWKR